MNAEIIVPEHSWTDHDAAKRIVLCMPAQTKSTHEQYHCTGDVKEIV